MTGVSTPFPPQLLVGGGRDYAVLFNAVCTTLGAAAELVNQQINVSSGDLKTGANKEVTLLELHISTNNVGGTLSWQGTTPQQVFSFPANNTAHFDFKPMGGIVNKNPGTTNDLLLSTNGWTTSTGSLTVLAVFRLK